MIRWRAADVTGSKMSRRRRRTRKRLPRRGALVLVASLLGASVLLLTASASSALELPPEIESFLEHAPQVHADLAVPLGEIGETAPREFGTSDQQAIAALGAAEQNESNLAEDTASEVSGGDSEVEQEDDDLFKKCLAEALGDLLSSAAQGESVSVESVALDALESCLKEAFGVEQTEIVEKLATYLAGETAVQAEEADRTAPEPAVFLNWVSATKTSLETASAASSGTSSESDSATSEQVSDRSSSGSGSKEGTTIAIAIALALAVVAGLVFAGRRRRE